MSYVIKIIAGVCFIILLLILRLIRSNRTFYEGYHEGFIDGVNTGKTCCKETIDNMRYIIDSYDNSIDSSENSTIKTNNIHEPKKPL